MTPPERPPPEGPGATDARRGSRRVRIGLARGGAGAGGFDPHPAGTAARALFRLGGRRFRCGVLRVEHAEPVGGGGRGCPDAQTDGLQQGAGDLRRRGGLADLVGADAARRCLVDGDVRDARADAERLPRRNAAHAGEGAVVARPLRGVRQGEARSEVDVVEGRVDEVGERERGRRPGGAAAPARVVDGLDACQVAEDGDAAALLQDDDVTAGPGGQVPQGTAGGGQQGGAQRGVGGAAAAEDEEAGQRAVVGRQREEGRSLGGPRRFVELGEADLHGVVVVAAVAVDSDAADLVRTPVADDPERVRAWPEQASADRPQRLGLDPRRAAHSVPAHHPPHARLPAGQHGAAPSAHMVPAHGGDGGALAEINPGSQTSC